MDLCYFPKAKVILNLDSISTVRMFLPRDVKIDFPELVSKEKRRLHTNWKCTVTTFSGENIFLSGIEAETFYYAIKSKVSVLYYEEEIENKDSDKDERKT